MTKKRVKKRTHVKKTENPSDPKIPKSFVIRTGKTTVDPISSALAQLVHDVRRIMEPNTATRLRERHSNKLKDYLAMAGPLGVTHLLLFSRTESGATLRIARAPRGPTIHFKIHSYSLAKDVKKHQKAPKESVNDFLNPPLLVLNGFTTSKDVKPPSELALLTSTLQNLFPPLSVQNTPVSSIRRVVLCNRIQLPSEENGEDLDIIDIRHYSISTKPVGVPRAVRKTSAKTPSLPHLGKLGDVADFVVNGADYDSTSEIDEDEKVEIRKNGVQQRAIKLSEIGPRLRLEMVKIEEGMCDGRVLYHRYVKKTKKEEQELDMKHKKKAQEKANRRKKQDENVARRKAEKEAKKQSGKSGEQEENEMDVDDEADAEDEFSDLDQDEMLQELENEMEDELSN